MPSPDTWGAVSRLRRDDELMLATQALKPGTDETSLSRFGDDRWDLAPAVFRENAPHALTVVDFAMLDDSMQRLTAKEFVWARLNEPSPCPTRARMAPTVARATLTDLSSFMQFVARQAGSFAMNLVDQAMLDAYLAELRRERRRTAERVAHLIDVPIELDRYSPFLTLGGFGCRPSRPFRGAGRRTAAATDGGREPHAAHPGTSHRCVVAMVAEVYRSLRRRYFRSPR
jgi:hypothetical protein